MSKQYCKLIMVTPDNNNKYYEMIHDGSSSNFTVKYGRIESSVTTATYPIGKWSSKYREKVNKGYVDVTDKVSVQVTELKTPKEDILDVAEKMVNDFLKKMKAYTDGLVSKTYSVKADAVSQKQVDDAQAIIDDINALDPKSTQAINNKLIELYTIIPRKMSQVKLNLLPNIKLADHMENEQDNLDAMASQVSLIKPVTKKAAKADKKAAQTLLDKLGLTMTEAQGVPKDIEYLIKQSHGMKVKAIFEVNKAFEDEYFDKWMKNQKDKTTRTLIHGTKCTSVIPILEIGLKIRPAGNFQFSGKAYGDGNYFSEHMQKSLGYTGWDEDKVILVYEVHTGDPFVYDGWYRGNSFPLTYKELQKRGFDSTFVKAGNGLLNSEIIAYNEEQNRIKYIIWLK